MNRTLLTTATSSTSPWKRQGRSCRNYLQNTLSSPDASFSIFCGAYRHEDAEVLLFVLGSSYHTAMEAVDRLRQDGIAAGVITLYVLRPFPAKELRVLCHNASTILAADRQDSYGAGGGNMSLELKAALSSLPHPPRILSRIYGLGGKDFFVEDALALFKEALSPDAPAFDYYGVTAGTEASDEETSGTSGRADPAMAVSAMQPQYFKPVTKEESTPGLTTCTFDPTTGKMKVSGGSVKDTTAMPMRVAPGHGACPGCGIPINVNLLLKGIEGNVVLLFQTGAAW